MPGAACPSWWVRTSTTRPSACRSRRTTATGRPARLVLTLTVRTEAADWAGVPADAARRTRDEAGPGSPERRELPAEQARGGDPRAWGPGRPPIRRRRPGPGAASGQAERTDRPRASPPGLARRLPPRGGGRGAAGRAAGRARGGRPQSAGTGEGVANSRPAGQAAPDAAGPGGHLGGRGRPGRGILGGQVLIERGQLRPARLAQAPRREPGQVLIAMGQRHLQRLPPERRLPGQALIADDAQRVQVTGRRGRAAADPLRGEITHRADECPGAGEVLGPGRVRDAEVGHLDLAIVGDQQVARLDVAVHHPGGVRGAQGRGRLGQHIRGAGGFQPPGGQHGGQGRPGHQLHHQVRGGLRARVAVVVHLGDAGMVQQACVLGLSAEPGQRHRVTRVLRPEQLHRHRPGQTWSTARQTSPIPPTAISSSRWYRPVSSVISRMAGSTTQLTPCYPCWRRPMPSRPRSRLPVTFPAASPERPRDSSRASSAGATL